MAVIARSRLAQIIVDDPSSKTIRRVAAYMVQTKRAKQVDLLVRDIERIAAQKGHVIAHVQSAHELSASVIQQIHQMVRDMESTDITDVEIDSHIDGSLLGGVIINTPEQELDLSLRNRLNRLKAV